MDKVQKAVDAWQRVYAQLMAAQERHRGSELRREPEVLRLRREEEEAMRAVHSALTSAGRPQTPDPRQA